MANENATCEDSEALLRDNSILQQENEELSFKVSELACQVEAQQEQLNMQQQQVRCRPIADTVNMFAQTSPLRQKSYSPDTTRVKQFDNLPSPKANRGK